MADWIQPYEGDEPYIFISYAHDDSDEVFAFLEAMNQAGYRFWYDEGIELATSWKNAIATHIEKCAVCIIFYSVASEKSKHCRREMSYVEANNKAFTLFYLEDVPLKAEWRMYFGDTQSVKKSRCPTPEAFIERLNRSQAFQPCRDAAPRESQRQETEREAHYRMTGTVYGTLTTAASAPANADGPISVFIDGKKIRPSAPVRDVKDAFCETFFALADSGPSQFKRFMNQYAFLRLTPPETKGYFSLRHYKERRMADGTVFYIGCHSGSDMQKRQTDNLCRFLGKPEGYVVWLDENNQEIYRYHANETADDMSLDDVSPTESCLYSRAAAQKVTSIAVYGDAYQTATVADALHKTFSLTLSRNPDKGRAFIRQYPNIVTDDSSKLGKSVFRSYKEIRLPGSDKPFYLACSTGFDLKKSQTEKLCDFMGLSGNDVVWYDGTEKVFSAP